jgi:exopolysaccharide production protein ExoY
MTFYDIGKRVMDIFGAIVGIVLFAPLMVLAVIWIKLVSPEGPVFADINKRSGKGGKKFRFLKFRSMVPNAHEWLLKHPELHKKYVANSYKLAPEEDPRLLKGADFMRKYSIDELPQFFNVLVGDMSIVGPRAYHDFELEEQSRKHPEAKEYIDKLLKIKPGITGPWQVGGRSEIGFVDRVKMDATYAENKSLLYDLLIILKTPYVVLTKKGAY